MLLNEIDKNKEENAVGHYHGKDDPQIAPFGSLARDPIEVMQDVCTGEVRTNGFALRSQDILKLEARKVILEQPLRATKINTQ